MVTCLIYLTGTQDSYFIWLYPLAIIVASILFSRKATFMVAGLSFILIGGLAELIYYNVLPRMQIAVPSSRQLADLDLQQFVLFHGRGLSLQPAGAKPCAATARNSKSSAGELQDLQAFNEDIIHSMRGGLLTTDLDGRILLLNRTGEEITGSQFRHGEGNARCRTCGPRSGFPAI